MSCPVQVVSLELPVLLLFILFSAIERQAIHNFPHEILNLSGHSDSQLVELVISLCL